MIGWLYACGAYWLYALFNFAVMGGSLRRSSVTFQAATLRIGVLVTGFTCYETGQSTRSELGYLINGHEDVRIGYIENKGYSACKVA